MKRAIKLILLILIVIIASGCSRKKANVIRINDNGLYTQSVQKLIREKKIIEQYLPEGISVEWTAITSQTDTRDAIVTGRVDIATLAITNFIYAIEEDFPLTLLSGTIGSHIYIYRNNNQIKSLEDIQDSTRFMVINKGSIPSLAIYILSKELYGDPFKFDKNFVEMPAPDMLSLVRTKSNEIDLFLNQLPYIQIIADEDHVEKIFDLTPIIREYDLGYVFCTNNDFYKKNRILVDAFIKAAADAAEFMNENTEEAALLLSKSFDIDPVYIAEEINDWPVSLEVGNYDKLAGFLFEIGLLSKPPKKYSEIQKYEFPK